MHFHISKYSTTLVCLELRKIKSGHSPTRLTRCFGLEHPACPQISLTMRHRCCYACLHLFSLFVVFHLTMFRSEHFCIHFVSELVLLAETWPYVNCITVTKLYVLSRFDRSLGIYCCNVKEGMSRCAVDFCLAALAFVLQSACTSFNKSKSLEVSRFPKFWDCDVVSFTESLTTRTILIWKSFASRENYWVRTATTEKISCRGVTLQTGPVAPCELSTCPLHCTFSSFFEFFLWQAPLILFHSNLKLWAWVELHGCREYVDNAWSEWRDSLCVCAILAVLCFCPIS